MNTGKLKILLADDHQLFVSGLQLILKDYLQLDEMDCVFNGQDAIAKSKNKDYDIIIMDINMPLIDGIEATREIKKHTEHTKILIVSMASDFATVNKALKAGADGFLIKNADALEFVNAFAALRKDQVYLSLTLADFFTKDKTNKLITKKEYVQFTENIVTPREQAILKMITEGHTNQVIADALFISVKTVDTHRNNMLAKLNLPNTAALVRFALENKLV